MFSKILNNSTFNSIMDFFFNFCSKYYLLLAAIASFRYESHSLGKWFFNLKFGFDLFYFGVVGLSVWCVIFLLDNFYYKDDEESVDNPEEQA